jgi:hypothetical protein
MKLRSYAMITLWLNTVIKYPVLTNSVRSYSNTSRITLTPWPVIRRCSV